MIVVLSLTLSFLIVLLIAAWGSGRAWKNTALADEALLKLKDAELADLENERKTSNELMRQGDVLLASKEMQIQSRDLEIAAMSVLLKEDRKILEQNAEALEGSIMSIKRLEAELLDAQLEYNDAQDRIETLTLENYSLREEAEALRPPAPKTPKKRRKVQK